MMNEERKVISTTSHYQVRKSDTKELVSKGKLTWKEAYKLVEELCDINKTGHAEYQDFIVAEVVTTITVDIDWRKR